MFEDFFVSGKKWRRLRKSLLKTQQEMAAALEMSLSNARRIEGSDHTEVRPQFLRRLAEIAGRPFPELAAELSPNGDAGALTIQIPSELASGLRAIVEGPIDAYVISVLRAHVEQQRTPPKRHKAGGREDKGRR
jgi:transcriptional regulator with XRE-family HTH domain